MKITYKFRAYPSKSQIREIDRQLEICRQVYNLTLKTKNEEYKNNHKQLSQYDLHKLLPKWKEENPEFKTVHSQTLQIIQERLIHAFEGFFRRLKLAKPGEKPGFPKEKEAGRVRSLGFKQVSFSLQINSKKIKLSKIGLIKTVFHRTIEGQPNNCTLVKYPSGKYYFCIVADAPDKKIHFDEPQSNNSIGIDLGSTTYATFSDGQKFTKPNNWKTSEYKVKISKGIKKARIEEKIANQRSDYLHKLSNKLIRSYNTICLENLDVKSIQQNNFSKAFNRKISDNGWSTFINLLRYKAVIADRKVILVNPAYTSQDCSKCGTRKKLELSDRIYSCKACGLSIDRDLNASINILRIGLADEQCIGTDTISSD